MLSRRQIREAVLQFLYSFDLEGGADPVGMRDAFWEFATESDRKMLLTATVRAVKHLAHGRKDRQVLLESRSEKAREDFSNRPEAVSLFEQLERIQSLESNWSGIFGQLEKELRDVGDSSASRLELILGKLFQADHALEDSRQRFLQELEDVPTMEGRLEPVAAALRRLQRISDRIRMIENPEQFPEQTDLTRIRESKADLKQLCSRANQMIDGVLEKRGEIDEALAAVVDNYAPERLDPVDRAILRLSCYEADYAGTPAKVAINEAVELARRFGTTDSPRFVNGVLDRVLKTRI